MDAEAHRPAGSWWAIGGCALLCVLTASAYLPLLDAPPYLDVWDHATVASKLLHGGLMYRDVFNEKAPGLYWISSALFALCGESILVLQIAALGCTLLVLALLLAAGVRLGSARAGLVAAALYALLHLPLQGNAWEPESLITPLLLIVLLLSSARRRLGLAAAGAGLALGTATLIKQTAWIAVALTLAFTALERSQGPKSARRQRLLGLILGLALPWALVLLRQTQQDNLRVFATGYLFPLLQYGTNHYVFIARGWFVWLLLPLWWMVFCAALLSRGAAERAREIGLLQVLLLSCVLMMLPAMFLYHFPPILACAALCCGLLAIRVPRPAWLRPLLVATWCALLALAALKVPWSAVVEQFKPAQHRAVAQIAQRVQELTGPDDSIMTVPYNSAYFVLSGRFPPGRHTFLLPWTTPPAALDEFTAALERRRPPVILYNFYELCVTNRVLPKQYLAPLLELLAARYRIAEVYENGVVLMVPAQSLPAAGDGALERALLFSDVQCLDEIHLVRERGFRLEDVLR